MNSIAARATYSTCRDRYGRLYRCRTSAWSRYGRWILTGILILIAVVFVLMCLCLAQRKRRKARKYQTTQTPMTAPPQPQQNYYGGDQQYNQNQNQNQYAPPSGAPPQNYGYGNQGANEGYYGQQQGVTKPQGAYVQ